MTYFYAVIDNKTGLMVARRKTLKCARAYAEKLDLAYGAYRYGVRELPNL